MSAAEDYVGLLEVTSLNPTAKDFSSRRRRSRGAAAENDWEEREEEEEEELELGLSLGAKKVTGSSKSAPSGEYCKILTAVDLPSLVSRASPLSSSCSSVSSSDARTKRAADSVAPDVSSANLPRSPMVVGWPPIRAYRMNSLANQSKDLDGDTTIHKKSNHSSNTNNIKEGIGNKDQEKKGGLVRSSLFIKVNMDGDPIGRKVNLNSHLSYETLALALELMFHRPTTTLNTSTHGTKASKLLDGSSDFALTYEDKDGDWMLVGDVPWGMFLNTVKRLRIMRTSDANGLVPKF